MVKVLGIETSCDETAVAIVDENRTVLAAHVYSQLKEHQPYAGVVPEIAARAHLDVLPGLVKKTLAAAAVNIEEVDAIAATTGPGLIGGLIVGSTMGKAMALAAGKPFLAINHLEGHALSPRLIENLAFPYLLLLVSGGHTQFVKVNGVSDYTQLGTTIDDAAGEAFDKVAKLMGLGYPGGPIIEEFATKGNPQQYDLPISLRGREGCDFSFSGLKTAVRHVVVAEILTDQIRADVAASFQYTVGRIIIDRCDHAFEMAGDISGLVVAGGVAANTYIRDQLQKFCDQYAVRFMAPPLKLCTDNAEMIAWAGVERLQLGLVDGVDAKPRPRWPLEELSHG